MFLPICFLLLLPSAFLNHVSHFARKAPLFHFQLHRSTSTKKLQNIENIEYLANVSFGSNHQSFDLLLDTGSADVYIPSTSNKYCISQNKELKAESSPQYPLFSCSKSTTCERSQEKILLSYDDGDVVTRVVWDQVEVTKDLKIKNQSFLIADQMIGNFDCSGIWGLGSPELASNHNPGIIQSLLKEKLIDHYIFGLLLTSNSSSGSLLVIGGVDTSLMRDPNDIVYFPFVSSSSFQITIDEVSIGENITLDISEAAFALPDSGNSEITFPTKIIEQISNYFNNELNMSCFFLVEEGAEDYAMLSCEVTMNSQRFPKIYIGLNGTKIELEPEDYIEQCVVYNNGSCICETNLERSQIDTEILLGDAFLQSFYSIFNLENNTLGLAKNKFNNSILIVNYSSIGVEDLTLQSVIETSSGTKKVDWRITTIISGLLVLLPLVAFGSHLLNSKKRMSEGMGQTLMGVTFIAVFLLINVAISVI